jgi:hypothetical protein
MAVDRRLSAKQARASLLHSSSSMEKEHQKPPRNTPQSLLISHQFIAASYGTAVTGFVVALPRTVQGVAPRASSLPCLPPYLVAASTSASTVQASSPTPHRSTLLDYRVSTCFLPVADLQPRWTSSTASHNTSCVLPSPLRRISACPTPRLRTSPSSRGLDAHYTLSTLHALALSRLQQASA